MTSFWELSCLTKHYHPNVKEWSTQILENGKIESASVNDPLQDFSLSNFLDKIAYKQARSKNRLRSKQKEGETEEEEKLPINQIF